MSKEFQKPYICVPLVKQRSSEILEEAKAMNQPEIDWVEWRVDYYEDAYDSKKVSSLAKQIKQTLCEKKLLVTFRTKTEGGELEISEEAYKALLLKLAEEKACDYVDMEYKQIQDYVSLTSLLKEKVGVILSHHNFMVTPPKAEMFSILEDMEKAKPDFVKLAVMPQNMSDVYDLAEVTEKFTTKYDTKIISMSMKQLGMMSRIMGAFTRSAVTFAAFSESSAPGQLHYKRLALILQEIDEELNSYVGA